MELADCIDIIISTFEGVIVYRDLKPSNCIIRLDGIVALVDFDISWDGASPTASFGRKTPGYMSQRHADGLPPEFNDDLYSFGLVTVSR